MKGASLIVICALLGGCASTLSQEAGYIREADEKRVENCEFVGHVTGASMLGGAVQSRARNNARAEALEDAAKRGATHIVWASVKSTVSNGASAEGRAYRCAQ